MKRTAFRIMILAAAAVAAVTTASAQNLKAEIPFAFDAAGTRMQPGTYRVRFMQSGSGPIVRITNEDVGKGIMTLPRSFSSPTYPAVADPVLSFACAEGHCVLSSMRSETATVYHFPGGKSQPGAPIASITLKADRME